MTGWIIRYPVNPIYVILAGLIIPAGINIILSNPIISADLSGLSVIRSFIIRINPVYDKTDGGLNEFDRIRIDPVDDRMDHQISGQYDICNSGRNYEFGQH